MANEMEIGVYTNQCSGLEDPLHSYSSRRIGLRVPPRRSAIHRGHAGSGTPRWNILHQ